MAFRQRQIHYSQKLVINIFENATKAFVDGLGDPYTSYLDAEQFSGLQTELEGEGQIEGI